MSSLPLPVINRNRNVVPIPHKIFSLLTHFQNLTTLQFLQFLQYLTTFYNVVVIIAAARALIVPAKQKAEAPWVEEPLLLVIFTPNVTLG